MAKADTGVVMSSGTKTNKKTAPREPAKATPIPTRQAVVVLPMHRSGSSALSRVLNLLGCDLPLTLMGGDASNETGHWESTVVRALNDDLLASGGSEWQDWLAFNPAWYQTARPGEYLRRAQDVLTAEYGSTALLVLKDPRISRVFPFWRRVLDQMGIAPHVLLPLRHPAEVAASLHQRNGIPEVKGLLLWLRHVLEAEHSSRGLPRVVISYDRLLTHPVEVLRTAQAPLGLIWPRLSENTAAEIRSYIAPGLRHHKADPATISTLAFTEWLDTVFGILLRWSERGEDVADFASLDSVRLAMDSAAAPLRDVVAILSKQAVALAEARTDVQSLRDSAHAQQQARPARDAEKAALLEALDMAQTQATAKQAQADQLAQDVASLQAALDAARADVTQARSTSDSALIRMRAEHAALTQELGHLRTEAGKRGDALKAMEAEKATLTTKFVTVQKEANLRLVGLTTERDTLQQELIRHQAEQQALIQRLQDLRDDAATGRDALTALETEKSKLQDDLTTLQTEYATLYKEVRYLRDEAGKRGDALAALTAEKAALERQFATAQQDAAARLEALAQDLSSTQAARAAEQEAAAHARTEADSRLAKLQDEHAHLSNTLETAQNAATASMAALRAAQSGWDADREQMRAQYAEQEDLLSATTERADALRAELQILADRLAMTQAAWDTDKQQHADEITLLIAQNQTQATELTQAMSLRLGQEQAYQAQIAHLQSEITALERTLAQDRDALEATRNTLSETQSALRQRRHEAEETAAALSRAEADLEQLHTEHAALQAAQEAAQLALDAARKAAAQNEAARYDEIAELTRTLMARDTALSTQTTRIQTANTAYAKLNTQAEQLRQELDKSKADMKRLMQDLEARDIAATHLMAEIHQRGAAMGHLMGLAEQGRALADRIGHAIDAILLQAERPWLRGSRQLARKSALLRASGLFDADWYIQIYPDVAASGQDPAVHFILFGRSEGRWPLPDLARLVDGFPKSPSPDADVDVGAGA